jgi:8-oxo-dGTP pyrophosphatase MutT (NUDIX family)
VAYIVRDGRLVVFVHADDEGFDESGVQVPAGTVQDGELPEQAVLREAFEETGLPGLRIARYLGAGEYDIRPYADAIHVRHYFHLVTDAGEVPERWIAHECGDGDAELIRFELYWIPLAQAHVVAAGQAAFLGRLFDHGPRENRLVDE